MLGEVKLTLPREGTCYQWVDPTGRGRNWFALWGLVDYWQRLWIYREWPCVHVPVTGHGLPGVWAEAGQIKSAATGNRRLPGGVEGPAQSGFQLGLRGYKAEFARLEGWDDARSDLDVADWDPVNGARERIFMRYIDQRFANTQKELSHGETSSQMEMVKLGMYYELITGKASSDGRSPIDHGIDLINDALYFEPGWQEADSIEEQVNRGPKLFICEDCTNVWFALQHYTSLGGHKEATKDPIDCLRYALHSQPRYIEDFVGQGDWGGVGGRASQLSAIGTDMRQAGRKARAFARNALNNYE